MFHASPHRSGGVLAAIPILLVILFVPAPRIFAQAEGRAGDKPTPPPPRQVDRWSVGFLGGFNLIVPFDQGLRQRSEEPGALLLGLGPSPALFSVEVGYEFHPGLLVVGSFSRQRLYLEANNAILPVLPNAPKYIPVASGQLVGYAVEVRWQGGSEDHYFSDPRMAGHAHEALRLGFGQQRGVGLSALPAGTSSIGVSRVDGAARNYIRLDAGFQWRLGKSRWALDGLFVLTIGVSGHVATVITGPLSAFESADFSAAPMQYLLGVSYHF